ncbi:hypothetical protein HYS94_04680 [Candidatus Daviesbacteria bacterium]|nr:hypothetical protein [Candidatus Daviesbacteria bacterium]
MRAENELILGFNEAENQKAVEVLGRLIPHFSQNNLVIVGGLAIRHHLLSREVSYPQRSFNDLDLKIKDPTEIKPSICDEFWIYHYHPLRDSSFYIVLADPQTKIKIDIFDYNSPPLETEVVQIAGYSLQVRGLEDQFIKTLFDLMRITGRHRTDPKQFSDAILLMQIADLEKAQRFWTEKYAHIYPFTVQEAISQAEEARLKYPDRVFEHPYRRSAPYICEECQEVPGFPITPMQTIFDLLGYVE